MTHKLRIGQAVVPAFRGPDRTVTYEVVRLEPSCDRGEPRYLIRCRLRGLLRRVGEAEIVPAFP